MSKELWQSFWELTVHDLRRPSRATEIEEGTLPDGRSTFTSTQPGTGGDNPYLAGLLSTDPAEAAVAAARSVTLGFSSTGCFEIEFRIFPIGEDAPTNSGGSNSSSSAASIDGRLGAW